MTFQDVLDILSANPSILLFYFIAVPLTAFMSGVMDRGEGHKSPWKYLYSILIYLVTVPGLFALVLTIYLIIIEGKSVLDINLVTQVLPIASMVLSIVIIKRQVNLDDVPGFDKLSGLMLMILALLSILWILDKTRIVIFTHFPFVYLVILFAGLLMLGLYGWRRFAK